VDSIALVLLAVIGLVPATFVAVRIWREPFAGLYLWVLLLPVTKSFATFLGYPDGFGPAVLQKVTLADPVLLMTIVALLVSERGAPGMLGKQGRRVVLCLLGFCVVGLISGFIGQAGPEIFVELATYSWLCCSVIVICRMLSDRSRADRILAALFWAGVIAIAAGTLGTVLLMGGAYNNALVLGGKVTGLFERANQVQSFVVTVLPFLCIAVLDRGAPRVRRVAHGILVVLAAMTILASGSRAGIVFVALAIWLTVLLTSVRACIVLTAAGVLFAGSAWGIFEEYRAEMPFAVQRALSFVDGDDYQLDNLSVPRANQWAVWKEVFADHPIIGVGPNQFQNYVPRIVAGAKAQEAHDSYLAVLAETGVCGAAFVFTLLGTVLGRSLKFWQNASRRRQLAELPVARALLVAYVSLLLFGTLHNGLRQRYFWFVIALIISLPRLYGLDEALRNRLRAVGLVPGRGARARAYAAGGVASRRIPGAMSAASFD
jgi:O-antigen ligase